MDDCWISAEVDLFDDYGGRGIAKLGKYKDCPK